jgi:hypothetical protein
MNVRNATLLLVVGVLVTYDAAMGSPVSVDDNLELSHSDLFSVRLPDLHGLYGGGYPSGPIFRETTFDLGH